MPSEELIYRTRIDGRPDTFIMDRGAVKSADLVVGQWIVVADRLKRITRVTLGQLLSRDGAHCMIHFGLEWFSSDRTPHTEDMISDALAYFQAFSLEKR